MKLKEWRINSNLSQAALAKLLKVNQQSISQWESDRIRPEFSTMLKIEKHTGKAVTLDDWR